MNTAQMQSLIAQNSKGLPKEVLQEILDFIQFLRFKRLGGNTNSVQKSLSEMNENEQKHLDDEFADYKAIYPTE